MTTWRMKRIGVVFYSSLVCASWLSLSAQSVSLPGFEERRLKLVEKYDRNQDGRLDAVEREAMREGQKQEKAKQQNRSRRKPEPHPKELLAKYDKDKSGWIDGDEWNVAGPTESGIIKKRFDANGDDKLDSKERTALQAAMKSGEIKGLYAGIAQHWLFRLAGRNGRNGSAGRRNELLDFDKDGDGIASREELAAIRAARREKR